MSKFKRAGAIIAILSASLLGMTACDSDDSATVPTTVQDDSSKGGDSQAASYMPSKDGNPKEKWVTVDVDEAIHDENGVHPFLEKKCDGPNLVYRQHFMEWAHYSGYVTGLSTSVSSNDPACR